MRRFAIILICAMAGLVPALALDADIASIVERQKAGKPVNMTDATQLMLGAEVWCYEPYEGQCGWSEIYLSVNDGLAIYESSNAWNDVYDIHIVSQAELRDNRHICDFSFDWRPSLRLTRRSDSSAVNGRELDAVRREIVADGPPVTENCYDFVFQGADDKVITLVMRQYTNGIHEPDLDAVVDLYFDPERAAAISWTY